VASFPLGERFALMKPAEGEAVFRDLSRSLPRVTYAPTSVGFAMLIRRFIIEEFGVFDEIYGGGYNEENDLVMRASRCGYRAVLANKAFLWHEGEQSLGQGAQSKRLVEAGNRALFDAGFPQNLRFVPRWFGGV